MGIFDRLVDNAARNVFRSTMSALTNDANSAQPAQPVQPQQYAPAQPTYQQADLTVEQKLDMILASDFAGYQVAKNVSPQAFGDTGANTMPYSYMISQNGVVKLLIMICFNNTCSKRGYRFSKQFAASRGMTMINFVVSCPNEESYIRDRLHQYL